MLVQSRALRGSVFFIPLLPAPAEFLTITARARNVCVTLPPAPAMCMSTPARTCKTLRIYACTVIEMHCFVSSPVPQEKVFVLAARFRQQQSSNRPLLRDLDWVPWHPARPNPNAAL